MLQGQNLGEKHKSFNALVQKAQKNAESLNTYKDAEEKCILDRLFKIELAVKTRDVDYIIQTLKSDDTLYVSRALKATWLITDEQYAHIINPEHLYTVLFPQMYNKAVCKLKLTIRLHLKSEERCQQFYNYLNSVLLDTQSAFKFLPSCSEKFVEQVLVENHDWYTLMNAALGKRICERFPNFIETIIDKVAPSTATEILESVHFMATTCPELYFGLVEKYKGYYHHNYSNRLSKILVTHCPEIIMKSYDVHLKRINEELISKYWPAEKIEQLIKLIFSDDKIYFCRNSLEIITKRMSPERREEILNEHRPKENRPEKLLLYTSNRGKPKVNSVNLHLWYDDVPFDIAFTEIVHLVRAASDSEDRYTLLKELIRKTSDSEEYLYKLLHYYYKCHMNEVRYYKLRFLNSLHDEKRIYKMGDRCWKIVNDLYISIEVYSESNYFIHNQNIIYYSILHSLPIPQNIMEKYLEKDPVDADYLKHLLGEDAQTIWDNVCEQYELKCENLRTYSGINKPLIDFTKKYIKFIKKWEKELADRPYIIKLVSDIVRVKPGSIDYPTGRRTRRLLFEHSILISQDKGIILNILKHDPNLLRELEEITEKMVTTKKMILYRRVLQKIATYFNNEMAEDMKTILKKKIKKCEINSTSVNNIIRGLSFLTNKKEFLDCIQPYKPTNYKIDWSNDDIFLVNIRKAIAQNLHHVRPSIDMDTVHEFAKGDYLQLSVPALLSTCSALPLRLFKDQLPKILDSPVSIMRHGIRLAYVKLDSNSLIPVLQKMWKECKNIKIRFVIFDAAFKALSDEKDEEKIQELWSLMKSFIVTLHEEDDKNIFLGPFTKLNTLPRSMRCEACQVCYEVIKGISMKVDSFSIRTNIIRNVCDWLNDGIDVDLATAVIIENFTVEVFSKDRWSYWELKTNVQELFVKHITSATDEKDVEDRYEKTVKPVFSVIIENWNLVLENNDDWIFRDVLINLFKLFGKTFTERISHSERNFISMKKMYDLMEKQFEDICNIKIHFSLYLIIKFLYITEECIEEINLDESQEVKYKIFAKLFSNKCAELLMYLLENNFYSLIFPFGECMKDFVCRYLLIKDSKDEHILFYVTVMDTLVDGRRNIPENILGLHFIIEGTPWCITDETKSYLKSVIKRIRKIKNPEIRFHLNKPLNEAQPTKYKQMVDELEEESTETEINDDNVSSDEESITLESSSDENFADKTNIEITNKPNYSYCTII